MATIDVAKVADSDNEHTVTYLWEELDQTDLDGEEVETLDYVDRSVQVVGTFDSATCAIQGSNDGTNWSSLTDPAGNAIELTAAGLVQVIENCRYIRPLVSSAGASTDLDVYLHVRKTR